MWDKRYSNPVVIVNNSQLSDADYTSFEPGFKGNWIYSGEANKDTIAIMGEYSFKLNEANIEGLSRTGLDINKVYAISYWSRNQTPFLLTEL